jgi:superfamily II DNA or RNA helicase
LALKRPERTEESKMNLKFEGELRDYQKDVKKEAIEMLNKTGSVLISMAAGSGKSITSMSICSTIKLKTLVIVNKLVLIKQWKEAILQFCPTARIQCLTTKSEMEDCDFYIMNAINVPKMGKDFFQNIKTMIVDEVHLIMADKLSNLMNFVHPRYLIGLSATPYRIDGLNILIDLYFGKDKIVKEMKNKHLVYKVQTGFKPEVKVSDAGKVIWSSILDSQAKNKERNELIVNIIKLFKDRNFLVLVKRVEHGEYLVERLNEEGEYTTSLLGSNQIFDKEARILVATSQKAGCGFDHPKLDALLLATDFKEYILQIIARVMRRRDVEPIIFDIVDDNPILFNHYKTRKETYLEIGGKVKMFLKEYPEYAI